MTANVTRVQLRDRIRRRVSATKSKFWENDELDVEINGSAQEYWDLVTSSYSNNQFTKFEEFLTTASTEKYDIATTVTNSNDDLYQIVDVHVKLSNGEFVPTDRFGIS